MDSLPSSSNNPLARSPQLQAAGKARDFPEIVTSSGPHIHQVEGQAAVTPAGQLPAQSGSPAQDIKRQDEGASSVQMSPVSPKTAFRRSIDANMARRLVSQCVQYLRKAVEAEGKDAFEKSFKTGSGKLQGYVSYIIDKGVPALGSHEDVQCSLETITKVFTSIGDAERALREDTSLHFHRTLSVDDMTSWCAGRVLQLALLDLMPPIGQVMVQLDPKAPHEGLRELLCSHWLSGMQRTRMIKTAEVKQELGLVRSQIQTTIEVVKQHPDMVQSQLTYMDSIFAKVTTLVDNRMKFAELFRSHLGSFASDTRISEDLRHRMMVSSDIRVELLAGHFSAVGTCVDRLSIVLGAVGADESNAAWTPVAQSISERFYNLRIVEWVRQVSEDGGCPRAVETAVLRVLSSRCKGLALDCRYLQAQLPQDDTASWLQKHAVKTLGDLATSFDSFKLHLRDVVRSASARDKNLMLQPREVRAQVDAYVERFFSKAEPSLQQETSPQAAEPGNQPEARDSSWMDNDASSRVGSGQSRKAPTGAEKRRARAAERRVATEKLERENARIDELCDRPFDDVDGAVKRAHAIANSIDSVVHGPREHWISADIVDSVVAGAADVLKAMRNEWESRLQSLEASLSEVEKIKQQGKAAPRVAKHDAGKVCEALSAGIEKLQEAEAAVRARVKPLWEDQLCNVFLQYTTKESFWDIYAAGLLTFHRERPGTDEAQVIFHLKVPYRKAVEIVSRVQKDDGTSELRTQLVRHRQVHFHLDEFGVPKSGSSKNAIQTGEVGDIVDRDWFDDPDERQEMYDLCVRESEGRPAI